MTKPIFTALSILLLSAGAAQAEKLATVVGKINNGPAGGLIEGKLATYDKACKNYLGDVINNDNEFSGAVTVAKNIKSCDNAVILLDLEASSFCQDQGGFEYYSQPAVVSVDCQD